MSPHCCYEYKLLRCKPLLLGEERADLKYVLLVHLFIYFARIDFVLFL